MLAYSPDRLSRKYAYQIPLIEELARNGVETIFVKAPQGASAEDQQPVQFQGMISEYERAQILERSRCGKRHCAQSGEALGQSVWTCSQPVGLGWDEGAPLTLFLRAGRELGCDCGSRPHSRALGNPDPRGEIGGTLICP